MQLSDRTLNRTLWVRQQLVPAQRLGITEPEAMLEHLLGLQGQDSLPPYLSLDARIAGFDPQGLSQLIESRRAVRVLSMRGTIHVLTADDALALRPWLQECLDRQVASRAKPQVHLSPEQLVEAATQALSAGPLSLADLAARLVQAFPEVPVEAMRSATRGRLPLVQVPPRGLWRRSGSVVYELQSTWLGRPDTALDLPELVRRYLRAYGPASAADMTRWSTVTGLGPVFAAMADELVQYRSERGKVLWDVPDAAVTDDSLELPPLLLGAYDNLWLAHAETERIASAENRRAWTGRNGGTGAALFVDGLLEGIWRLDAGRVVITPLRTFTRAEQRGIDADVERVQAFLGRAD